MNNNKKFLSITFIFFIAGFLASKGISVTCRGAYIDSCSQITGPENCRDHYSGLRNPYNQCMPNLEKDWDNNVDCIENPQKPCTEPIDNK